MFKRIMLITMLACCIPIMAQAANSGKQELKIVLDQEALMELGYNAREDVLSTIQKQAEKAAKTAEQAQVSVEDTMGFIAGVNVEEFKGKAVAFAEAVNVFCEKIGVTVNDFITTPAGNFIIFGVLWKLGVFGSIWGFFKGFGVAGVLVWLLYSLNTKKIVKLNERDHTGAIIRTEETLEPRFSAIFSGDGDEMTAYSICGSILVVVLLFITICFII